MRLYGLKSPMKKFKSDRHTTNSKHFTIFKKEARLWIDRLGLKDWTFYLEHRDSKDYPGCLAWVTFYCETLVATVGLSKTWGEEQEIPSSFEVKRCAMHEVYHVLFARLTRLAESRYIHGIYLINEEEHALIRRFENVFYGSSDTKAKM